MDQRGSVSACDVCVVNNIISVFGLRNGQQLGIVVPDRSEVRGRQRRHVGMVHLLEGLFQSQYRIIFSEMEFDLFLSPSGLSG